MNKALAILLALCFVGTACSNFGRKFNRALPEFLQSEPGSEEVERVQERRRVLSRTEEDLAIAKAAYLEAKRLYDEELWDDAADAFDDFIDDFPDTADDKEARFLLIKAQRADDEPDLAAKAIREFLGAYPLSLYGDRVEDIAYELAVEYLNGDHNGLLYSSEDDGVALMRLLVLNFPNGRYADEAYWRVGNYKFDERLYVEAEQAYTNLVETYPESEWASRAQFNRALSYYSLIKGIEYDEVVMQMAVKHFRLYLRKFPEGDRRDEAQTYADRVQNMLCEKQLNLSEWYDAEGEPAAARFYLVKARRLYSDTPAAARIEGMLADLPPVSIDIEAIEAASGTSPDPSGGDDPETAPLAPPVDESPEVPGLEAEKP